MNSNIPNAALAYQTKAVTKVYGTDSAEVHALRGVDLEIKQGETIVLLGASGSGKSTLLNILGGLDTPTAGQVFFHGADLAEMNDSQLTSYRRRYVGFIFQLYNLMPGLTARENVSLVTEIAENPMSADEALHMVGLGSRMDHFPSQLSGGEQQRVAIARAIAKRPTVLFCDEPTGALDSQTSHLVLSALEKVVNELNTTMVMVTHHQGIAPMADRVIHFRDGNIEKIVVNETRLSADEVKL